MDISSLLLSGLTGAVTGYVTNDVAVRMLFRSFGPFGGVLESTREEFIFNMSELVEEEIINYETIAGELDNPLVKDEINRFVTEFISVQLPQQFSQTSWQEISGWEESCSGVAELLSEEKLIDSLVDDLTNNTRITDAVSSEQLSHLIEQLLRGSGEILEEEEVRRSLSELLIILISSLYDPETSPGETLTELKELQRVLADHRAEIREKLQIIIAELEIPRLLEREIETLLSRSLNNWFASAAGQSSGEAEDINSTLADIFELLQEFLHKPEGKELVEDIFTAAFSALQEVDLTLPELMDDNWEEVMLPLLQTRLPELLEVFLDWIEENRQELEEITDEAIEEVLSAGSGFRNQIKNIIFRALQGNIARRYGILNKVIKNLNNPEDKSRLAHQLTEQLAELLENKTVGWFFYRLDQLEIVDWQLIHQLVIKLLNSEEFSAFKQDSMVFSFAPADFIAAEKISSSLSSLLPEVLADVLTNLLLAEGFAEDLNDIIHDLFKSLNLRPDSKAHKKLQDFLGRVAPLLTSSGNASRLAAGLTPAAVNHLSRFQLAYFLQPELKTSLVDYLQREIKGSFYDNICKQEDRNISYMLEQIQSIAGYQDKFTNFALEILEDNLPLLLEDQISQAVSDNLLDLSTEDMRVVVENFMGQELKPLTYFGGLLGFTAGFLMETFGGELMAAAGGSGRLGVSMLVYGLVGFITNVTAINMIFRPYNSINLGKYRIPFTPGLMARNQERFAAALGDFIEDDLLDPRQMSRLLKANRDKLESTLQEIMLQDSYRRPRMVLRVSSDNFADNLVDIIKGQLRKNSREISACLAGKIEEELSLPKIFTFASELGEEELEKNRDVLRPVIAKYLTKLNKFEQNYSRLIPRELKSGMKLPKTQAGREKIFEFDLQDILVWLKNAKVGQDISRGEFKAAGEELLSPPLQNKLTKFLADGMIGFLRRGELADVLGELDKQIWDEALPEKILEVIPSLVQENISAVLDIFLERILTFLSRQRENIKDMAAELVEEELEKSAEQEGFFGNLILKGAYRVTDGRSTLDNLIDNLIDDKLPDFLQSSRDDIGVKLEPIVTKMSREISHDLFYESRPERWADLITGIAHKPEVEKNIRRFIGRFSSLLWQVEISPCKSFGLLSYYGGREESDFFAELQANYRENRELIDSKARSLFALLTAEAADKISPARTLELLTGLSEPGAEELQQLLAKNEGEIYSALRELNQCIYNCGQQDRIICKISRDRKLFQKDILIEDINLWLRNMGKDNDFWSDMKTSMSGYMGRVSALLPRILQDETVEFFADKISRAGMDSLEIHFQSLLESVAIKETAVNQVEEMDPAAIESLFKSFAGRYLNRLKMYGWSGSLFGALAELVNIMMSG